MEHVLSGLISKRIEIKSEMIYMEERINELKRLMESLDVSIKIFDPEFDLKNIKDKRFTKKSHIFKHGEANTLTLDILRKSNQPLTTREIAIEIMKHKKLNIEDLELLKTIEANLRALFYKSKLLKPVNNNEKIKKWKIELSS